MCFHCQPFHPYICPVSRARAVGRPQGSAVFPEPPPWASSLSELPGRNLCFKDRHKESLPLKELKMGWERQRRQSGCNQPFGYIQRDVILAFQLLGRCCVRGNTWRRDKGYGEKLENAHRRGSHGMRLRVTFLIFIFRQ